MTPQEKAKELIEKFMETYPHKGMSRNAALICVEEIIEIAIGSYDDDMKNWWLAVKEYLKEDKQ